jgi:hypothetical protein
MSCLCVSDDVGWCHVIGWFGELRQDVGQTRSSSHLNLAADGTDVANRNNDDDSTSRNDILSASDDNSPTSLGVESGAERGPVAHEKEYWNLVLASFGGA